MGVVKDLQSEDVDAKNWRLDCFFLGKTFAFIKQGESTKVPNYQNARGCALMATTHLGGRPGSHGR